MRRKESRREERKQGRRTEAREIEGYQWRRKK
jgi:hypothetical protein